jgi:hypothetical protein
MVSPEMIKSYVENNHLSYLETSSKTNENVEKCFIDFTRILIEHTNQMELKNKINPIDLNTRRNPVKSGCKCTII